MTTTPGVRKSAGVSPLILRVAVAGILAYSGWQKLTGPQPAITPETPTLTPAEVPQAADAAADLNPTVNMDATAPPKEQHPVMELDDQGVKLDADWPTALGIGELGVAAVLLIGLLTRLVGAAGVAATGVAAGAHVEFLNRIYDANPLAVLLLGAICLSLLVSGSGPMGLDRAIFRRRKTAAEETNSKSVVRPLT